MTSSDMCVLCVCVCVCVGARVCVCVNTECAAFLVASTQTDPHRLDKREISEHLSQHRKREEEEEGEGVESMYFSTSVLYLSIYLTSF